MSKAEKRALRNHARMLYQRREGMKHAINHRRYLMLRELQFIILWPLNHQGYVLKKSHQQAVQRFRQLRATIQ